MILILIMVYILIGYLFGCIAYIYEKVFNLNEFHENPPYAILGLVWPVAIVVILVYLVVIKTGQLLDKIVAFLKNVEIKCK